MRRGRLGTRVGNGVEAIGLTAIVLALAVSAMSGVGASPATGATLLVSANDGTAPHYSVTFVETGLAPGTSWTIEVNDATQNSSSSTITFLEQNGTYNFSVGDVAGYTNTGGSGSVTVTGLAQSVPVTFTTKAAGSFPVTFVETGLAPGTSWTIEMNDATQNSSSSTITFLEQNGTYSFSVGDVPGYASSTTSGAIIVNGGAATETINFTAFAEDTYLQVSVLPINASVTVNGRSTIGSEGVYVWTLLPGSYYVNVTLVGYTPYSNLVIVTAGMTTELSIVLTALSTYGYLVGTVTPATATVIASGVIVPVEDGAFNVTVAPGAYYLSVTSSGYESLVLEANVVAGQTTHVTLNLTTAPKTVTLSGELSPANGSVVVNGFIAYVNATGHFQVSVLPGTYTVSVSAPGYFPLSENLTIFASVTVNFTLTKVPGSTSMKITGNVTATGYNITVTELTSGNGSISVTFTSQVNGTLLVTIPYAEVENATLAQVLSSHVYVNGVLFTDFAITVTANYTVVLTVRGLPADPTLLWTFSSSGSPSGPASGFLGLPGNIGVYLLTSIALVAIIATALVLALKHREGRPPLPPPGDAAKDAETTMGKQPSAEDLLTDVLAPLPG